MRLLALFSLAALISSAAPVRIYVANSDDDHITAIDVNTEEPAFTISPGGVPRPLTIDARPDGSINRLFVQLSNLHGFETIDYEKRSVSGKYLLPKAPPDAKPLIPATFSHGMAI